MKFPYKARGCLADLALFFGKQHAMKIAGRTGSELSASDITVFGLGKFGSRMISRLSYEMKPLFEKNHSAPTFIALDTDKNFTLASAGKISASSLVILMTGMGGATGTHLIAQLAQQVRRAGALTVSVVTVPENDTVSAQKLSQLEEVSDLVFAQKLSAQTTLFCSTELCVTERARRFLDAEKWMLKCAGGLLQAVAMPTRTIIGREEIRRFVEGADAAAYGSAYGRNGREIGRSIKAAIDQTLACRSKEDSKRIRSALIVCSGPAEELRWPNVQIVRDEFCNLLGSHTPCLFGIQVNEFDGPSRVKTNVWLTFSQDASK